MTGRILIVDDVATNRIVMKAKLSAAYYEVNQAHCGQAALKTARDTLPDLILLDVAMPDMSGAEVCRQLKSDPQTAEIPVILITTQSDNVSRMAGLEAGADDFLTKPVDDVTLLARVRSLLRARDTVRELHHRGKHDATFGLAEAMAPFDSQEKPINTAIVAPKSVDVSLWKTVLEDRLGGDVAILHRENALPAFGGGEKISPDVFIIFADLVHRDEGLRLLSDLQSRPSTRYAAFTVILPQGDRERAAIAFDLGATDILYDPFNPEELAIRIRAQSSRKRQSDQLRESVRAGLELAVTDSLTGLHNRRYALYHLDRMLAQTNTHDVALMMLDIDHFKRINDEYGHWAGDRVLIQVAQRLQNHVRDVDLLARIGGEEFLVALPNTTQTEALECAERLRQAIGEHFFHISDKIPHLQVTLSVGLAVSADEHPFETAQSLLDRADRALYVAKSEGRDQVAFSRLPAA